MAIDTNEITKWAVSIWKWICTHDICLIIPVLGVFAWAYKRSRTLHKNLKRPIFLFEMAKDNLLRVNEVLKETQLHPLSPSTNITSLDSLTNKHSVCVVGYQDGDHSADILRAIISRIRSYHTPLIIYSEVKIPDTVTSVIRGYSYSEICNSPLRVVTLINSICQTFPYEKR